MLKLKLLLLSLFVILSCTSKAMCSKDTTIFGKASNAKYGAVVVTSNNDVYYIDKLKSWSSDFIDRPLKVIGRIVTKKLKKTNAINGGITSPGIKIIKRPRTEILAGVENSL